MGWFNAKDNEKNVKLPELPELPDIPEPAPPSSVLSLKKDNSLDNLSIPEPKFEELPELPEKKFDPKENPALEFKPLDLEPRTRDIGTVKTEIKTPAKKSEPVFIRIDKFQIAVDNFKEIHSKILEIEEILIKTKEIKEKEEQELTEWEKELQLIKIRLDSIDKNLLSKLD